MTGEPKDKDGQSGTGEVFTKEAFEKAITEREATLKAEIQKSYETKIKELNTENASRRVSEKELKETLVKAFGLNPEDKTDKDIISEKIAEIAKQNKELAEKYEAAEKKASLLEKQNKAKDLAEKAGLKAKAVKLMDLNAENLEDELKRIVEEFPELKEKTSVGTGSNPGDPGNTVTANPYKAESFNLTQQSKLEQTNPALAAKYKAEAGVK